MNQTKRTIISGMILLAIVVIILIGQNNPKLNTVKAEEKVKTHVMKKVENQIWAFKTREFKRISNEYKEN